MVPFANPHAMNPESHSSDPIHQLLIRVKQALLGLYYSGQNLNFLGKITVK